MESGNGQLLVESGKQFDRELMVEMPETLEVASLGESLKLVSRTTVELNHAFATKILELPEFDPDRPLDNNHVLRLKAAMERGTFLPEQVMIVTCSYHGGEYRMNGQHTAWARLEMPEKYRCPVQHLRYKAETENDMRRLYASIDRNKGRTAGNVIISYLYGTPEWEGYSKATLRKVAEGMAYWMWDSSHHRSMRDADDRAYLLMTEKYDLAKKVAQFIDGSPGANSKHILRRPVVGAMFATFNKAAGPATEFWTAVRDGVGFSDKSDPRLVLRNYLTSASIAQGRGAEAEKKAVNGEEMHRWCLYAWNAWRNSQPVKMLKAMLGHDRPRVV